MCGAGLCQFIIHYVDNDLSQYYTMRLVACIGSEHLKVFALGTIHLFTVIIIIF